MQVAGWPKCSSNSQVWSWLRPSVKPPSKRTPDTSVGKKNPAGPSAPVPIRSDRSLDETSRLLGQSAWRRCCSVDSPEPTAAASRWGPPPPPPAVERRSSTRRPPPPLYETENCLLSSPQPHFISRVLFLLSLATADFWMWGDAFFCLAHGAGWLQAHLEETGKAAEQVGELQPLSLRIWSDLGFVDVRIDRIYVCMPMKPSFFVAWLELIMMFAAGFHLHIVWNMEHISFRGISLFEGEVCCYER